MFNWYKQAKICYVFLVDLDYTDADRADSITPKLAKCRWFTCGWCLQELIAPKEIRFYDPRWNLIGTKSSLRQYIFDVTGINRGVLKDSSRIFGTPIARRMSWASKRQTTRVEDMAYSLLGIFDVNMPMLYGEGEKVFSRLQEEIIKKSNDLSIFSWEPGSQMGAYQDLFAPSPAFFHECYDISLPSFGDHILSKVQFSMSNRGLMFIGTNLEVMEGRPAKERGDYGFPLDCYNVRGDTKCWKILTLKKIGPGLYVRTGIMDGFDSLSPAFSGSEREIYILPKVTPNMEPILETCHRSSFEIRGTTRRQVVLGNLEPREAWDRPRTRFFTQPSWSFTGYLKVYLGEVANPKAEFYMLMLYFVGPQHAPLVALVHPDVWAQFDMSGASLAWKVRSATKEQETVSRGSAHELWVADNKITVSLNRIEKGGVPVHEVVLDWTPHGEDRESTLTYSTSTDSGIDGQLGDETWWDEGDHCYGISEGEVDEEIEQESYG